MMNSGMTYPTGSVSYPSGMWPQYGGYAGPSQITHRWGSPEMGRDPNEGLVNAMNRLAAAIEKFNQRKA